MSHTRRAFLCQTAIATAALATVPSPLLAAELPRLVIRGFDKSGQPLSKGWFNSLFLMEAGGDRNPLPHPPREAVDGALRIVAPSVPFGFSFMTSVEGFGTVRLYADNQGKGYRAGQEVVLHRELAACRLRDVEVFVARTRREGHKVAETLKQRLEKARALLRQADAASAEPARMMPLLMQSLCESVWAGEEAVLERARQAITRRGKRKGFLFGCNFFGYPSCGEAYESQFAALFNFATLPLYWASFEPQKGKPGFAPVDQRLEGCGKHQITAKGHPLSWFHEAGCPKWMEGKPYAEWRTELERRITEIVTRYRGRIKVYDVINEAHDWGNVPQFTQEQLLELTKLAADATHAADPAATRVINNCCLLGEYAASGETYRGKQPHALRTPLQYLRAVKGAGIAYDAIGLQVYYPEHDLFEISRMLDRYAALGKPLHVTELGTSSQASRDEISLVKTPTANLWHAPWSENIQADWIEQFYTLCYAHPAVEAITWWDFADRGHFWPHGGFLRSDMQPKESYQRLLKLRNSWA
jgi:endo-1,4-beta-xylanase